MRGKTEKVRRRMRGKDWEGEMRRRKGKERRRFEEVKERKEGQGDMERE